MHSVGSPPEPQANGAYSFPSCLMRSLEGPRKAYARGVAVLDWGKVEMLDCVGSRPESQANVCRAIALKPCDIHTFLCHASVTPPLLCREFSNVSVTPPLLGTERILLTEKFSGCKLSFELSF